MAQRWAGLRIADAAKGRGEAVICDKGRAVAERRGWDFIAVDGSHIEAATNHGANLPHLLRSSPGQTNAASKRASCDPATHPSADQTDSGLRFALSASIRS